MVEGAACGEEAETTGEGRAEAILMTVVAVELAELVEGKQAAG